ncbi:MAG: glycosyltransferase family 9 protein [Verrucomicrobiota bacterium]
MTPVFERAPRISVNILIVKPTALGDVAQALRVAPLLKKKGFCTQLDWLVDEDYIPLVRFCPEVNNIIPFPRRAWSERFSPFNILQWAYDLRMRHYDIVIDLQGLARSGIMTWLTASVRCVGLKSSREGAQLAYSEMVDDHQEHAIDRYKAAVEYLLEEPVAIKTKLSTDDPLQTPFNLPKFGYTVLHPYSNWNTKIWPWRYYQKLVDAMPHERFVLVGQGDFFPCFGPNLIDVRNRTDVAGLIEILRGAKVVISTDSGPAHIAAAFDRPLVTLFGSTDELKTAPRAKYSKILSNSIECRPCLKRLCKHKKVMGCMEFILLEDVIDAHAQVINLSENNLVTT